MRIPKDHADASGHAAVVKSERFCIFSVKLTAIRRISDSVDAMRATALTTGGVTGGSS
jgi:hypothetical protein